MTLFSKLAVVLATVPVLAISGSALADSPGQLEGGTGVYVAKNVTQNGSYDNNVNTACSDQVRYSIRLHNIAFGGLTNIKVSANLLSGKMTAVPAEGVDWGTSDNVAINLPANGSLNYESGSATLYNAQGGVIKTLPDGITTVGVNIGGLNGSTTEFVNFNAKVNCPPVVTPPVVSFACTELAVANIDRTHYDFTAKSSVSNATVTSYGFTVKDANGNTVDTNTVTTNANSAVYHFNQATGTYTVSAVVNTDHGSTSASACSKQVIVAAVPTTPTTPVTPTATALPNTGAGDVVGIFAGASAAGTAAHAIVSRRRRSL